MAIITNQAALTYNNLTTLSNVATGELVETLAAAKTSAADSYAPGDNLSYVISLTNSGSVSLTGLTVGDDLGAYQFDGNTVRPLSYVPGSVLYYINGVLQTAPAVTDTDGVSFTGISVPAGGNAVIVYRTAPTGFAPLENGGTIVNTATVTGGGLVNPVTAQDTIAAAAEPVLSIRKTMSPTTVTENGTVTYTLTITNTGNTEADVADNAVITDTFDPILSNVTVTYNGAAWTQGTNYTYDEGTGLFTTAAGQITVPAATYTRNADGSYTVVPGTSTVVVTGTV